MAEPIPATAMATPLEKCRKRAPFLIDVRRFEGHSIPAVRRWAASADWPVCLSTGERGRGA